ncbi:hypothetical protein QNE70_003491 [Vibrio vulnificus]|uniref:hypothetical protein n=1 Tax=Vibrio vulnificus TaxID=672 RepID=UPI001A203E72|nr:hypothetical protein [Vibrio vulnificus]ELV8750296.1 hypothetical protein [Vibrio vulnificus]ELV8791832.1 hypothetical protein [Vibrio vulnificus]MCA4016829.1 hypothetical protein [Vibrio vulnificus]HAS6197553.1 hypothetical protein [Vibrio vulnificus]
MFENELIEARENYEDACEHHAEVASRHREGTASDDELMEAIESMRQAQEELEEVRSRNCSY